MAITFAAGAFINIANNTATEFTKGAVGVWFRRSGVPVITAPVIMGKVTPGSGSSEGFDLILGTAAGADQGKLTVQCKAITGLQTLLLTTSPTTSFDGKWHMASANLQVTAGQQCDLYFDGANRVSGNSATTWDVGGTNPIRFARSNDAFWGSFDGSLAHAFYYNETLTDAEHLALACGVSPLSIRPHALLIYLPMTGPESATLNASKLNPNVPTPTTSGTLSQAIYGPPIEPVSEGFLFDDMTSFHLASPGLSGSWGSTETKDVFAASGGTLGGSWTSTEAKDVFAASGGTLGGSWVSTEAKDIFSGSGYPQLKGTFAATESKDVFNATVGLVGGTIAATESKDIFSGVGTLVGTWNSVEIKDGFSGAGYEAVFAAWGSTEISDTFHGSGGVLGGSWTSNEIGDTFHGSGGLVGGAWHSTEIGDILDIFDGYRGTWGSSDARDHFAATAWVLGPTTIIARMNPRETGDHFAFTRVASISGTMAIAEVRDHIGVKGVIIPIAAPIPRRKRRIMIVT